MHKFLLQEYNFNNFNINTILFKYSIISWHTKK
jgi:hypothetical protein